MVIRARCRKTQGVKIRREDGLTSGAWQVEAAWEERGAAAWAMGWQVNADTQKSEPGVIRAAFNAFTMSLP